MLSKFVRETRMQRGLSQRELAKLAGTSNSAISKIEYGRITHPSFELLGGLAKALKVPLLEMSRMIEGKEVTYIQPKRAPLDLVRELTQSLPDLIPIYKDLSEGKPVEYTFLPQPITRSRGREMKLFGIRATKSYKDIVREGDILIVARDLKDEKPDLGLRSTRAGFEICKYDGGETLPIVTIIRHLISFY